MAVETPATNRFGKTEHPLPIAMVTPPWCELPPTGYGGIKSLVSDLVNTLSARGHEVTLIGAGRNRTHASRFVALFEKPLWHRLGEAMPEVPHAAAAAEVIDQLDADIVHDHTLAGPLLPPPPLRSGSRRGGVKVQFGNVVRTGPSCRPGT